MKEAILLTRNLNCSELTKEQFAEMMMEDLRNAVSKSEEVFKSIMEAAHYHRIEQCREAVEKRAYQIASKRWKTEKRREQYVSDELAKLTSKPFEFRPVLYFDFNLEPASNGISSSCILDVNATKEHLYRCYEEIRNNKYFMSALGWQLIENRSFRSRVKLILPEEMEALYKSETERLNKEIEAFYNNTTYYGD